MAKSADIGSKRLISLAPTEWVRWLTGDESAQALEIISGEFQWIERATDALIKVRSSQYEEFLIANEMQLHPDARMPQRITAYAALAREKYGLEVYPVAVNIIRPPSAHRIVTSYHSDFMGLTAHQDFRVINLWEIDASQVFRQNLVTLLPFVPLLKNGDNEQMIQRAASRLSNVDKLAELEALLAFFASFVLELDLVRRIMRWDMALLRESPWYTEILQEGIQLGIEQGEVRAIKRFLQRRFGFLSLDVSRRIEHLTADQIEELLDFVALADSMESVISYLASHVQGDFISDESSNSIPPNCNPMNGR